MDLIVTCGSNMVIVSRKVNLELVRAKLCSGYVRGGGNHHGVGVYEQSYRRSNVIKNLIISMDDNQTLFCTQILVLDRN